MAKFNKSTARPKVAGPIHTASTSSGRTFEGAAGYARDAKSELFLLAVSHMVSTNEFYESADARDERYERLVRQVAVEDGPWTLGFLTWLRGEGNMRSASLVAAAEAVKARLEAAKAPTPTWATAHEILAAKRQGGPELGDGVQNRRLIGAVLQRADEPGEMLAYWHTRHGRKVPIAVKRGIADASVRLYNERSLLKWDSDARAVRFGDVIELTNPAYHRREIQGTWRYDLFGHAIDRRHGRDKPIPASLRVLAANRDLRHQLALHPAMDITPELLGYAGMTWEDILSLLGSKVDKGKLWSALIPLMGLMALAKNLRNFDQEGVPDDVAATVAARFADPEQVAGSRMFPFRWLAAYRAAPSLRWGHALDKALSHSLSNVPFFAGRTLILVDQSPSMFPQYAYTWSPKVRREVERSGIHLADKARLFGAAVALRCEAPTLVQYGLTSEVVKVQKGGSLLRLTDKFHQINGTATFAAARAHFAGHDRVLIITDEQTTPGQDPIPANVPVYTWNLGGYEMGHLAGGANRHTFGGMTDAAFRLVALLDAHKDAQWPWVVGS